MHSVQHHLAADHHHHLARGISQNIFRGEVTTAFNGNDVYTISAMLKRCLVSREPHHLHVIDFTDRDRPVNRFRGQFFFDAAPADSAEAASLYSALPLTISCGPIKV